MRNISKKRVVVISIIVFILLGVIVFIVLQNNNSSTAPQNPVDYSNLTPNTSSRKDAIKILGEPLNEKSNDIGTILEYPSSNPNWNNEITIKDNKIIFIKEIYIHGEKNISDIIDEHGSSQYKLYGPGSNAGLALYPFPEKGFAFLGLPDHNIVEEIWYFPPTEYENFKKEYANKYSEEIPHLQ